MLLVALRRGGLVGVGLAGVLLVLVWGFLTRFWGVLGAEGPLLLVVVGLVMAAASCGSPEALFSLKLSDGSVSPEFIHQPTQTQERIFVTLELEFNPCD